MRLAHLALPASDLAKTAQFYVDALGLTVAVQRDALLVLTDGHGFDLTFQRATPFHATGFHVGLKLASGAEVARTWAQFRADPRVVQPLTVEGDRAEFRVRDPDGYEVEVFSDPWEP